MESNSILINESCSLGLRDWEELQKMLSAYIRNRDPCTQTDKELTACWKNMSAGL
jgi:hypothetical protein